MSFYTVKIHQKTTCSLTAESAQWIFFTYVRIGNVMKNKTNILTYDKFVFCFLVK